MKKSNHQVASEANFQRILVGVDDAKDAQLAFGYAIKTAQQLNAELIIATVLESDEMNVYQALNRNYVQEKRQALAENLDNYQKQALDAGVKKVKTVISEGDPGETIVKNIIPATKADLLIIGSDSKKGIQRHFGSQAAYMAKYAPISVMVVR